MSEDENTITPVETFDKNLVLSDDQDDIPVMPFEVPDIDVIQVDVTKIETAQPEPMVSKRNLDNVILTDEQVGLVEHDAPFEMPKESSYSTNLPVSKLDLYTELLGQNTSLKDHYSAVERFQRVLLDKFDNTNNDPRFKQHASIAMNGLVENIQRGFSELLNIKKQQTLLVKNIMQAIDEVQPTEKSGELSISDIMKIAKVVQSGKK